MQSACRLWDFPTLCYTAFAMPKESLWARLQRWAHQLAEVQARILLTIIYGLFVLPVGLIVRLTEDALALRLGRDRASHWRPWAGSSDDLRQARRQG